MWPICDLCVQHHMHETCRAYWRWYGSHPILTWIPYILCARYKKYLKKGLPYYWFCVHIQHLMESADHIQKESNNFKMKPVSRIIMFGWNCVIWYWQVQIPKGGNFQQNLHHLNQMNFSRLYFWGMSWPYSFTFYSKWEWSILRVISISGEINTSRTKWVQFPPK